MACKQNINIKTAMLSSKEKKNAKIKYTLKKSNKIIVQIKKTLEHLLKKGNNRFYKNNLLQRQKSTSQKKCN